MEDGNTQRLGVCLGTVGTVGTVGMWQVDKPVPPRLRN